MDDEETRKREINSLLTALEEFGLKQGLVITGDKQGEERMKGKRIVFKPLWQRLLE